jgi:hypothetical protein
VCVFAHDKIHTIWNLPTNFNKKGTDVAKSEHITVGLMNTPVMRDKLSCGLVSIPYPTASYNRKLEFFTTEFI